MSESEKKQLRRDSPSPEVVATMRAEYATGLSMSEIARRHGVPRTTVQTYAAREGWKQDAELAIQQRMLDKLALISSDDDAVKRDEAVDAEAQRRADVRFRHRREWEQVAGVRQEALQKRNENADACFNALRIAKITAEMTEIQQRGEAKAWGLDGSKGAGAGSGSSQGMVLLIDRN